MRLKWGYLLWSGTENVPVAISYEGGATVRKKQKIAVIHRILLEKIKK